MTRNSGEMAFYVVQFLELPYEGIDDYVCVPHTWVIIHRRQDGRSVIAYPEDKDPSVTRDRAKRKERCSNEWKFYVAAIKYQSSEFKLFQSLFRCVLYHQSIFKFRIPQ